MIYSWKLLCEKNSFILDDKSTRPISVKEIIKKNLSLFKNYLKVESKIDQMAIENVDYRTGRPNNEYSLERLAVLEKIETEIKKHRIMWFHCTRLIDMEIENISKNWLKPLDKEFTKNRIKTIFNKKLISKEAYNVILENNESNNKYREGNICFFHSLKQLKDELWLHRLLRSRWGEAIYCNHESNQKIFGELRQIGKPCIIIAFIDYKYLKLYRPISETMIKNLINKRNDIFDWFIKRSVKIFKIITIEDPKFEQLIDYKNRTYKIE